MTPFDFINDLSNGKKDLSRSDPDNLKSFNPFLTNRSFSYFPDTLLFADAMNQFPDIDPQMLHDFYLHGVRARKRFSKWAKKVEDDGRIQSVASYYKVNLRVAAEYVKLLPETRVEEIHNLNKES